MLSLLRHGYASLRRSPALALAIIATLGVALAATVLVFSFLNTFLLRPLALLISAALLLRSQRNLAQLNPGFPLAEFDQFRVGLRGDTYRDPLKRLQFFERLRDNLRAHPR